MSTTYFVTPAPGHYGDRALVVSTHRSLDAAKRSAKGAYVVRRGNFRKGDYMLRSGEALYPIVFRGYDRPEGADNA